VNYEVENMRVGDRTDFNRLRILIETNGTITPREALEKSIEIMIHQLKAVIGFQEEAAPIASVSESFSAKATKDTALDAGAAKVKITELDLSVRVSSALEDAGIKSAAGLARKSASALKEIDGIGDKAIEEIGESLARFGLTLKSE
jgi:DNA-directed RNA polymerase subunit alpha